MSGPRLGSLSKNRGPGVVCRVIGQRKNEICKSLGTSKFLKRFFFFSLNNMGFGYVFEATRERESASSW